MEILKENAIKAYEETDINGKHLLENLFGRKIFIKNIMERIKTFEDACEVEGVDPGSVFSASDTADEVAYKKLKLIIKVINEDWIPDFNNTSQYKYYPYFRLGSGGGFVYRCLPLS